MRQIKRTLRAVCQAVEEKQGEALVVLDISKVSSFTDFFIVCNGRNPKQNQTICDEIVDRLKNQERRSPDHVEGYQRADWILIDYLEVVIHIFLPAARGFYKLEKLWSDGEEVQSQIASAL